MTNSGDLVGFDGLENSRRPKGALETHPYSAYRDLGGKAMSSPFRLLLGSLGWSQDDMLSGLQEEVVIENLPLNGGRKGVRRKMPQLIRFGEF